MRTSFFAFCAAGLAALAGSGAAAAQDPEGSPIIVTGTRLVDAERALRDCLARRCPTMEDIAATLALAENQFIAGDYSAARATLLRSRDRNRAAAARHPVAVSSLYRALSRITRHMGEDEEYQRAAFGVVRSLRAGLSDTDPRTIVGQFDVAEMYLRVGRYNGALDEYERIARRARAAGQITLAGHADLRAAWVNHAIVPSGVTRQRLEAIAAATDPRLRVVALEARIVLARIDYREGRTGTADAVIAELAAGRFNRTLIHAPPMQPLNFGSLGDQGDRTGATTGDPWHHAVGENDRETWADVGFNVRPDGRVEDVAILRSAGPTAWTRTLLASIQGRLYSPSNGTESDYRVERFSYTSPKMDATGTRLRVHSGEYRIEQIDLTAD